MLPVYGGRLPSSAHRKEKEGKFEHEAFWHALFAVVISFFLRREKREETGFILGQAGKTKQARRLFPRQAGKAFWHGMGFLLPRTLLSVSLASHSVFPPHPHPLPPSLPDIFVGRWWVMQFAT